MEHFNKTNPKDQELRYRPCENLHQEKLLQLAQSCVKLKSVSCTSNLLAQTRCTKFPLMLILSLPGLQQNQNLEAILVCIVVLYVPHDNIVWVHLCDECKRLNVLNACHRLWSIL